MLKHLCSKKFTLPLLVVMIAALVAACGPTATTPAETSAPAASESSATEATETATETETEAETGAETGAEVVAEEAGEAVEGGTVNLFISSSPDTFLPHYSIGAYARHMGNLMYPRLLRYLGDTTLAPYLAESWEISADGLVYTFNLAEGVTWTDGEPVTADDVVWTYTMPFHADFAGTRSIDAPIVGAAAYKAGEADSISGLEAVDDYTLQITLEKPFAPFLENVAQFYWILPEHVFSSTPVAEMDKISEARTPTVTSGPLNFVQYQTDQYVEFDRNENFFLGAPIIEKFIYKIMKADVALAQFETGELDTTTKVGVLLPEYADKLATLDVDVYAVGGSAVQSMGINHRREYFQDPRVRQALVAAIDREAIVEALLAGYGEVPNSKVPSFSPYYNPEVAGLNAYDPDKAKALLEEAGWDFDRELILTVPTGNIIRERSGPIIQQYLQAIGLNVTIETMDFASQSARVNENNVDLWLVGNSYTTFDPDETASFHSESLPPNGWNSWYWNNPEADAALEAGMAGTTFEERKVAYDKMQMVMAEDVPVVFLYLPQDLHAVSSRLQGAVPVPVGIEWNIWEWHLTE